MASTATTNIRLEKQEQSVAQTWGTALNTLIDIVDASVCGLTSISTTGGTTTLTNTDYTVTDAKYAVLRVTGTTTSNVIIRVPTIAGFSKTYLVLNETVEGGSSTTVTIDTSGHAGVAVARNCAANVLVRNIGGTHNVSYVGPVVVQSTGAPNSATGAVASSVEVTATGNLSSVTAQAALVELQGDIDTINTTLTNSYQPLDSDLTAIAALANTKGNMMVGNGSAWTALGIGSNYTLHAADSSAASGTAWLALGTIITNQTAETTVALADTVPIYDASATAGRKMTVENILKAINLATEDTDPDSTADFVLTYDTSASGIKKVKPGNFDAASDTAGGLIELAIQSEMETATDVARAVTPGRQHYHPTHPKAWGKAGISGSLTASSGISSVTDNGAGDITWTWTTAFSSANYCPVGAAFHAAGAAVRDALVVAQATTTTRVETNSAAGNPADPDTAHFMTALGDV
jgi:hypothetical protein